jgi:hypothetical protein
LATPFGAPVKGKEKEDLLALAKPNPAKTPTLISNSRR